MSNLRKTVTHNNRRRLDSGNSSADILIPRNLSNTNVGNFNEGYAASLPAETNINRSMNSNGERDRRISFTMNDNQTVQVSRDRLPYHNPPSMPASRTASVVSLRSSTEQERRDHHNMAIRYRLFSRLDPGGSRLLMPDHVLPDQFFSILPFDDFRDEEGKQGSIVTIFSIWNTMMGTSLLAMPWALSQAGLVLGTFLILFMAGIALYTAYRIVQSPNDLIMPVDSAKAEVSDVCRYFWGKKGEYTSAFFSIITLLGGVLVYWVLMSNFLYYTVNVFHDALQPNSTIIPSMANKTFKCDVYCPMELMNEKVSYPDFSFNNDRLFKVSENESFLSYDNLWTLQGTVPIILFFLVFPLMNFKSPTFFTKFNMLGTISVLYLITFTVMKAFECGLNIDFSNISSPNYAPLWRLRFPALTGTLALSYFIHNAILTILRNQKNPENNARDLSIGYSLSAFCYLIIGTMFYVAFPTYRSCISDNFLNNFGTGDVMSATARLFLLFQMITVLPLLMYFIRSQFYYAVSAVLTAIFYPHVGSILRYIGAMSGLVYIFALPCAIHLKRLQLRGELKTWHLVVHGTIVILGFFNLVAQLFVFQDKMKIFQKHLLTSYDAFKKTYSTSIKSQYVGKIQVLNYWSRSCSELERMYSQGKVIVLLDKQPLIKKVKINDTIVPELVKFDFNEIKQKFKEYGLEVGKENTVLLDVIPPEKEGCDYKPLIGVSMSLIRPDPDSGIDFQEVKRTLAADLGGECLGLRMCILTMKCEEERNYVAKLQSTMKWHRTFRLCPYCGGVLIKKLSKASCTCSNCHKTFYPTISPVSMTIISDPSNEYCLLVRHLNGVKGVFTVIAGFANPGETLKECAKREVAEEVGVECHSIVSIDSSQPWPIPDNSLISPFYGVVDKNAKFDIAQNEIECAKWFSRNQVLEAIKRTDNDPYLKKLPLIIEKELQKNEKFDIKNKLYYIPPPGALAYNLIKMWAENPKGLINTAKKISF
uniref:NAD(+) diphosphatase n=1 Tax=Parastrongyloides trichosuri TaxID=131310 RepID=A0A0N4ZHU8_PARTI